MMRAGNGNDVADVSRETFDMDTPLAQEAADEAKRRVALAESSVPLPENTRIIAVSNQKGGVGKTTTTVNLAAALAREGARVLVIDLDPQANASTALGVDPHAHKVSAYDALIDGQVLRDGVVATGEHENISCLPANIDLAGAEIELVAIPEREHRLRTVLNDYLDQTNERYHYVFIDCPPSLGLLTVNAFVAAREVLIPIQCEYYALEGLSLLLRNVELIRQHLNPNLRLGGIVLTMFDGRTNLSRQVADDVREHFGNGVLETVIPRSVRVSEAPSHGQSVIGYEPGSSGALSYREAAAELARRGGVAQKEKD